MPVATLAIVGLVKLATCASLVLVGWSLRKRGASSEHGRVASNAFVAWWWGIAAYMAVQGATEILAAFGVASLREIALVRLLEVPIDAVAVWGIMTYVAMLLFDKPRVPVFAGVYAAVATALYVAEALLEPQRVSVTPWSVGLAPVGSPTYYALSSALFGVPLLLALLAYATLLFRVPEPLQRYRVGLVSTSLFAWVAGGLLATIAEGGRWIFAGVTGLGLLAPLAALAAYRPPPVVLAKLAPHDATTLKKTHEARERHERLQQRLKELI